MRLKQLPNLLTAVRFFSIPILWFLALYQQKTIFTILFIITALTDIFDGFAARKLKAISKFGAKFDTVSDDLMTLSAVFWIYFLIPEILTQNIIPLLILLAFFVIDYLVRIIKHKTIELPFHTVLDKIGALTGFLFLSHALIFGYSQIFLYVLVIIGSLMAIEETLLCLTRKKIDENTKSIFFR
ncbi:CDP-alcohol phosphatidyltransferase family protein [Candidatus Woesearchaeota archaeon]|nr:CDP-alcohol phosphatidyltransferase family protein [Candidatus Woesearchaeota archaeon]